MNIQSLKPPSQKSITSANVTTGHVKAKKDEQLLTFGLF